MNRYMLVLAIAIDRLLALGQKPTVNGTPAIVFAEGKRTSGFMPATGLENTMAAAGGAK